MEQLKATIRYSSNETVDFESLVGIAKEMTSRSVMERVVKRLGLTSAENEKDNADEVITSLQELIFVEIKKGSNLIDVRAKETSMKEAILLINTTVEEYLVYKQRKRGKDSLGFSELSVVELAHPLKRSYPDRHWSQLFVVFMISVVLSYFTFYFFQKSPL